MKRYLLTAVLLHVLFMARAADYYWTGGPGSWSQLTHWRLDDPSGTIPLSLPAASDNIFFGDFSGFGANRDAGYHIPRYARYL